MKTQLLVSVRSAIEAEAALAGGADIVDVKEPRLGSLGRPGSDTVAAVIKLCATSTPVSVALGELRDCPLPCGPSGIRWAKAGLSRLGQNDWEGAFCELANQLRPATLVPVAYADAGRAGAPCPFSVLDAIRRFGGTYMLLDTYVKDGRGLLNWMPSVVLAELQRRCRAAGVALGLAGSLTFEDIAGLLPLCPAIIAVRGAVCRQRRRDLELDGKLVNSLKTLFVQAAQRSEPVVKATACSIYAERVS